MELLAKLEKHGPFFWMATGSVFAAAVGVVDTVTGSELAFALFYLIPIVLVTWFADRKFGIAISLIAAITWYFADILGGQTYSQPMIGYWNAVVRMGLFVVVTSLIPALKTLEREKQIACVDYLTGIANRRHFFEVLKSELDRSQRYKHPFTIVYFDLDGFKAVNDQFGHRRGDKLLCAVVNRAKKHLRKTDLIARLGGDEFCLLLPETDRKSARSMVQKIQSAPLNEMRRHNWRVTFSIGVLAYRKGRTTVSNFIKRADDLMYSVKNDGKNAVVYAAFPGK